MSFEIDDVVVRKSYHKDIHFVIEKIEDDMAFLKGLDLRLNASSPLSDLEMVSREKIRAMAQHARDEMDEKVEEILNGRLLRGETKEKKTVKKKLPGRILHLDGDENFLKISLKYYDKLKLSAIGVKVKETEQAIQIKDLLKEHSPDILILTGHDAITKKSDQNNINSYRTSKCYIDAVREARKYQASKDSLFIFAGACQSYFEKILAAGANFASSPKRVSIHALDPVLIAEKIAYGSFSEVLSLSKIIENTITGIKGIGGMESRGMLRNISPGIELS